MQSFSDIKSIHSYDKKRAEALFCKLDLIGSDEKPSCLSEIANELPWQISIYEVIDGLENPSIRTNSRSYASTIQIERVKNGLRGLVDEPDDKNYSGLEKGVYLLSSIRDPFTAYSEFKAELDRLAFRVFELFELNRSVLTEDIKVNLLSRVLSQEEGYVGNQLYYNDPDNSFLTRVMKTKLGIPISLSVIYILVATRLKLPVYGTNLPLHFLLQYESTGYSSFLDPYHGGVQLDRATCEKFLVANGYENTAKYFYKAGTLTILKRIYRNLIHVYRNNGLGAMEKILTEQFQILSGQKN